jgi:SAM-dependent methyltransferase
MKFNIGNYIIDKLRYDFIRSSFKKHKFTGKLLDLGCGRKPYQEIYDRYMDSSLGIDVEQTLHKNDKIDKFYDGKNIPYEDSTFDFILCTEVLEHVEHPAKMIGEMNRVLKPDGIILMTTPFLQILHETPYDFYRYTPFALRSLVEEGGFELKSITGFSGAMGFFIASLIRYPLKVINIISKAFHFDPFYSIYNPLVLIFIILPQYLYLLFARNTTGEKVFSKKTCKGYAVIARKKN